MKKTITQQQYETILSIFNDAIASETSHIKNRVKGSGAITMRKANAQFALILSPNSESLKEIERVLKEMIK